MVAFIVSFLGNYLVIISGVLPIKKLRNYGFLFRAGLLS